MKEVKVASYKEVGLNYSICEEIYENGTGKDIDGYYLEIGFLKEVFDSALEYEDDLDKEAAIKEGLANMADLDDEILIEF